MAVEEEGCSAAPMDIAPAARAIRRRASHRKALIVEEVTTTQHTLSTPRR